MVAHSHADDATGSVAAQAGEKPGMLLQNALRHRLIADLDGLNETKPGGAALHEQVEDPSVAELVRNHVR
jgi:hypothetical protein